MSRPRPRAAVGMLTGHTTLRVHIYWDTQNGDTSDCVRTIKKTACTLCVSVRYQRVKETGKGKVFPLQAWAGPWGPGSLRLPDFYDFRHYEGGKVVTLTHWSSLPPGVLLVLIFRGWVDPRAHGSVSSFGKESPATPLRIDPEILRLVGQCLNHYALPGPKRNRAWGSMFWRPEDLEKVSVDSLLNLVANIQLGWAL
jgi:hypothetical protein